jgi:membrane protein DedA with SNARE-associated domain
MTAASLIGHFPYFGVFTLLVLGGMGLPFPEGGTLLLCGYLIFTKVIKLPYAVCLAYAGVIIGDYLFYSLGRRYGRGIVTKRVFRKVLSPQRLQLLEERFNRWGILFILIGGRVVGEIFLVAGILKMPRHRFLMADALSSLLSVAVWTALGYVGGSTLETVRKDVVRIEHVSLLLIITSAAAYLLFRHVLWSGKEKKAS